MTDNNIETDLYRLNPTRRFSGVAENYAKYRPSYPTKAISVILEGLANPSQAIAADIGAGTGISSRLLAARGVRVLAIEPNPEMRKVADLHPSVEWREGTAEKTNLPDASVDLVTCFQAFHWFAPEPSLLEFRRILKPGGKLAIVWNQRNLNDKFTKEYSQLLKVASSNHPAEQRNVSRMVTPLQNNLYFTNVLHQVFPYRQELDLPGLIGRTQSASYIPNRQSIREQLVAELHHLHRQWADNQGQIYLVYRTEVYLADAKD